MKGRQVGVVTVLLLSMIGCWFTRTWAYEWKRNAPGELAAGQGGVISSMNSFALGLMLGGLRGPLVMFLWSKVENQKIDRDLEDIDTMIEWIRLLQPEFDTVHIFQIWNKAYNLSVMMASPASKYTTILDAIDYARRVEADRPGDINILAQLSQVYSEKLGGKNVTEHAFYRRQFREDTLTDASRARAFPEDARRSRLGLRFVDPSKNGPILDENDNLLPQFVTPKKPRPANIPPTSDWNDGSELQYLKKYEPFPYGVSATAIGYNFAKRAQVSMTVGGQQPLQVSDSVIDSRPGITLKEWAEAEADDGVVYEAKAFAIAADPDSKENENRTAPVRPGQTPVDPAALHAAVYHYGLSSRLAEDATAQYQRHLNNPQYLNRFTLYQSHLDELTAVRLLSFADHEYLASFEPGADQPKLLKSAADYYQNASLAYARIILMYYIDDNIVDQTFPPGYKRANLSQLPDPQVMPLLARAIQATLASGQHLHDDDRDDYLTYLKRAQIRLKLIGEPAPATGSGL